MASFSYNSHGAAHALTALRARCSKALYDLCPPRDSNVGRLRALKRLAKRTRVGDSRRCYIIYRETESVGIFSNISVFLNQISYALHNGLVPVIDMLHFANSSMPDGVIGRESAWEYFFEQPAGASLAEALTQNAVFSNGANPDGGGAPSFPLGSPLGGEELAFWRDFYHKYIRFNAETLDYLEGVRARLFSGSGRILGVKVRGTDYAALTPEHHSIQPSAAQVIELVEKTTEAGEYGKIFLATEDSAIAGAFEARFGEQLVTQNIERFSLSDVADGRYLPEHIRKRADCTQVTLDYICDIYLLSRCDGYIGGMASGGQFPLLMRDGDFDEVRFFDLGHYE